MRQIRNIAQKQLYAWLKVWISMLELEYFSTIFRKKKAVSMQVGPNTKILVHLKKIEEK